jgi:hypothetical protein
VVDRNRHNCASGLIASSAPASLRSQLANHIPQTAPRSSDLNTMKIPNPTIVVEVFSPSTAADDNGVKLDGYFSLGSVTT